jgi:hypothetical protein
MADHYIPFANFRPDWPLVSSLYSQAAGCRTTLQSVRKASSVGLPLPKLWVDAEVDGLSSPEVFTSADTSYDAYKRYILQFEGAKTIADSTFQQKPSRDTVAPFVDGVLNAVVEACGNMHNLGYISIPQLPYIQGSGRNKINRLLAELTLRWKSTQRRSPRLILPITFARQRGQADKKTDRTEKIRLALDCFEASGADGVWVVDSTLDDQAALSKLENERLPGLIHFHEELNEKLPSETVKVGGPYWGLNLILWARGLVRFPAIGLGRSYQYAIPGRQPQSARTKVRIALPPLKCLLVWSPDLKDWLDAALRRLSKADSLHGELTTFLRHFDSFQGKDRARKHNADFYFKWLRRLESASPSSRAVTLYQDFSSAFVIGKRLHQLSRPADGIGNPAAVAKQLMVNCL